MTDHFSRAALFLALPLRLPALASIGVERRARYRAALGFIRAQGDMAFQDENGETRRIGMTSEARQQGLILRAFEHLRDLPFRLRMGIEGSRYDSHPFDLFSSHCPVCGDSYEGHEFAVLGSALPPWDPFVSAVENRDWRKVVELGEGDELIGKHDLAIAMALVCHPTEKAAVFLYRSPGTLEGSFALISQQILSEHMTQDLRTYVSVWRPAIRDRLESIRNKRVQVRVLRRAAKKRTSS